MIELLFYDIKIVFNEYINKSAHLCIEQKKDNV